MLYGLLRVGSSGFSSASFGSELEARSKGGWYLMSAVRRLAITLIIPLLGQVVLPVAAEAGRPPPPAIAVNGVSGAPTTDAGTCFIGVTFTVTGLKKGKVWTVSLEHNDNIQGSIATVTSGDNGVARTVVTTSIVGNGDQNQRIELFMNSGRSFAQSDPVTVTISCTPYISLDSVVITADTDPNNADYCSITWSWTIGDLPTNDAARQWTVVVATVGTPGFQGLDDVTPADSRTSTSESRLVNNNNFTLDWQLSLRNLDSTTFARSRAFTATNTC